MCVLVTGKMLPRSKKTKHPTIANKTGMFRVVNDADGFAMNLLEKV